MTEINFNEFQDPAKFARFMDHLLSCRLNATPIRPPNDKGRDSYIISNGTVTIYQYKYFLFAMNSTQKKDVEDSLKTALTNYTNCHEWVLCLPREITTTEEKFIEQLSTTHSIKISIVGAATIKKWVQETNFPLDQYFDSQLHKKGDRKLSQLLQLIENPIQIKFETIHGLIESIIKMESTEINPDIKIPIEIKTKLVYNKFSSKFEDLLRLHMTKFSQVEALLKSGLITRRKIESLISSLKMVYLKNRHKFDNGDEIFAAMLDKIIPENANEEQYTAAIVLLSYFFHTCEVFEDVDTQ